MPTSDVLLVFGLLAAMGLTSLAAGLVAGLLGSIRRSNRTSALRGQWEAGAGDRPEKVLRITTPSAPGRGANEQATW